MYVRTYTRIYETVLLLFYIRTCNIPTVNSHVGEIYHKETLPLMIKRWNKLYTVRTVFECVWHYCVFALPVQIMHVHVQSMQGQPFIVT